MKFFLNPASAPPATPPQPMARCSARDAADVEATLRAVFDYRPTPMRALPAMARKLGIAELHVKDEGARLGLRSFKALGGAYAVLRLIMAEVGKTRGQPFPVAALPRARSGSLRSAGAAEVSAGAEGVNAAWTRDFHDMAASMTFVCATDGNHGQSVAAGARLAGAHAAILVHEGVTQARRDAIARFGAEVIEVAGTYDDAVAESMRLARERGWTLLSDTTWPGYESIPQWVMQGYTLIAREAERQLALPPTHVFLQAGVGGFAAALASAMADQWSAAAPAFIVVEPARAACLYESARAGRPVKVDAGAPTLMSMLECYEPSHLAWRYLQQIAAAFMTVDDEDAVAAMRALALPERSGEAVLAGESGAAGMAGLLAAAGDAGMRRDIGLDEGARVLLVNTESATDEARFQALLGISSSDVALRAGAPA
ncbi:diaminopropionate ammonia-lyase [Bordetella genomosp. 10]|uniref:Diaminopropionate ammonia-lyase n=1 Tax=Bordetella genomosp. 10 TaxID=1416804 RepID=A0A261SKH1_9BORD|nr:diaminopropionate ammonia-lyase [Bordetella genomosp. 10]OZI37541.1 diaminopropionate ammonia-lyase [Bordetella genomosp. 10]